MCFEDRQSYASILAKILNVPDCEFKRSAETLRQIYICKLAAEKNIIASYHYPSTLYENSLYASLFDATTHKPTFVMLFNSITRFFNVDISRMEIFALEGQRESLALLPAPPCPVQFPVQFLPGRPPDHPPPSAPHRPTLNVSMPFGWGKKSSEHAFLLDEDRKEEERRRKEEEAIARDQARRNREEEKRQERERERAAAFGKFNINKNLKLAF